MATKPAFKGGAVRFWRIDDLLLEADTGGKDRRSSAASERARSRPRSCVLIGRSWGQQHWRSERYLRSLFVAGAPAVIVRWGWSRAHPFRQNYADLLCADLNIVVVEFQHQQLRPHL